MSRTYGTQSTEAELIAGCCADDRRAQQVFYERYAPQMLGVCMRYASDRDEARDILNQAFLKIFQHLPRYRTTGSLGGWMARIVMNTAIDHIRSLKTYRQKVGFELTHDPGVRSQADQGMRTEDIYRLLQKLPPASRNVFSLYVIDGYKHREIGELLGIDEATSRWHLAQARKALQAALRQPEPEPPMTRP